MVLQSRALQHLVVTPLQAPDLFTRYNLTPARGVLLHGPPGEPAGHIAQDHLATNGGVGAGPCCFVPTCAGMLFTM